MIALRSPSFIGYQSPSTNLTVGRKFENIDELTLFVQNFAYIKRANHLTFQVIRDKESRSSSSVKFVCPTPLCPWNLIASISRGKGKTGRCEIADYNLEHSRSCMGTAIKPSLKWLSQNKALIDFIVRKSKVKQLIAQAASMGLHIERNMAQRLIDQTKSITTSECIASYGYVESWLKEFFKLNPGAQYKFIQDETTDEFIGAFLMLPLNDLILHSFLGALMIDCGFSSDPSRYTNDYDFDFPLIELINDK